MTYQVRVDIQNARPPIWRRLELTSDLHLDEVHAVLQTAFGWTDSHLYRFAVGSSPYDRQAAVYLCPSDVDRGADGIDAREVRLDELLTEPGDTLRYLYDFGDDWLHVLKVEHVMGRFPATPRARCSGGRRAGPPEDCGGVHGYAELLHTGQLDLPPFDVSEVDRMLQATVRKP